MSGIVITLLTAENEQNKHINSLSDEEILRRDTVLTEAELYKKTHQYEIDTENVPVEHRVLAQQMIQEGHFTSPDYQHKIHKKAQQIKSKQNINQLYLPLIVKQQRT